MIEKKKRHGPRYVPRSYLVSEDAHNFGHQAHSVRWKATDSFPQAEIDWFRASQMQHMIATKVRRKILSIYESVAEFSRYQEIDYRRLSCLLRGETILKLEDIAELERRLDTRF